MEEREGRDEQMEAKTDKLRDTYRYRNEDRHKRRHGETGRQTRKQTDPNRETNTERVSSILLETTITEAQITLLAKFYRVVHLSTFCADSPPSAHVTLWSAIVCLQRLFALPLQGT